MSAPASRASSRAPQRRSRRARAIRMSEGFVERDGVRIFWELYGDGEPDGAAAADLVDRATRATGSCRSRTSRATTEWSRSTGAATAGPTGRRTPRPIATDEFAADALAVMDATGTAERGPASGSRAARCGRRSSPPITRSGCDGVALIGPACRSRARHPDARGGDAFDDELDTDEGWAKYNRHYWLSDYRGFLEFFFAQMLPRAALDQADRGLRRVGARDDPGDAGRRRRARSACRAARACARRCARVRCPDARHPRRRDVVRPLAKASRWPSSPAASSSRSRAPATCPRRATR